MYCPHCGHQVEENDRFCAYCGKALSAQTPTSETPIKKDKQEDFLFRAEDLKEVQTLLEKGYVQPADDALADKKKKVERTVFKPSPTRSTRKESKKDLAPSWLSLKERARDVVVFVSEEEKPERTEKTPKVEQAVPATNQGVGKLVAFVVAFGAVTGVLLGIIFWAIA